MNIDYAQILKNSTARQEALKLLELNLRELDAIHTHLTAAYVRLKDMENAYRALDHEGRNLLDNDLHRMLDFADGNVVRINKAARFVENLIEHIEHIEHIDANKDS